VNCAVTQQGAAQSLGAGRRNGSAADLTSFCLPPAPGLPSPTPAPTLTVSATPLAGEAPAAVVATLEDEPTLFHGRGWAAATAQAASVACRSAPVAPHDDVHASGQPVIRISAPHSTQARLDTRPGGIAGDGDAGTEPPLPPAGGPLAWASAVAAAASGATPSGIAAILTEFALEAPLLLRAPEGSVVRRPTGALVQVDVPV